MNGKTIYRGGCLCGAVRYEATVDLAGVTRCNCTICAKLGQLGNIVKPAAFTLLEGESELTAYPNAIGKRFFCKHCGVHCFGAGHLEALGGDFVSINLNTLDDVDPLDVKVIYWDGRHDNWQAGPSDQPWRI